MLNKKKVSSTLGLELIGYIVISLCIAVFCYFLIFYGAIIVAQNADEKFTYPDLLPYLTNQEVIKYQVFLGWTRTACLIASFVFSVFSFLLMVGKKVEYIQKISLEVTEFQEHMKATTLDINGEDELSALAKNINKMTKEISEHKVFEENMKQENQSIIIALAHDIRTPLTAVMSYLEFAQKETATTEERLSYLSIAYQKAVQMKELTDYLFDYCKEYQGSLESDENSLDMKILAAQLSFEWEDYLLELGYEVIVKNTVAETLKIRMNAGALQRVLENILSNIVKYSDKSQAVEVIFTQEEDCFILRQKNHVKQQNQTESNGIGLKSSTSLLGIYKGQLSFCEEDGVFMIELKFPILHNIQK